MGVDAVHDRMGPSLGTLPSKSLIDRSITESVLGFKAEYELNEWTIVGQGDILLLFTDGLREHANDRGEEYFPFRLERKVRELRDEGARAIVAGIEEDMRSFAHPTDDVSLVGVKRTTQSA